MLSTQVWRKGSGNLLFLGCSTFGRTKCGGTGTGWRNANVRLQADELLPDQLNANPFAERPASGAAAAAAAATGPAPAAATSGAGGLHQQQRQQQYQQQEQQQQEQQVGVHLQQHQSHSGCWPLTGEALLLTGVWKNTLARSKRFLIPCKSRWCLPRRIG